MDMKGFLGRLDEELYIYNKKMKINMKDGAKGIPPKYKKGIDETPAEKFKIKASAYQKKGNYLILELDGKEGKADWAVIFYESKGREQEVTEAIIGNKRAIEWIVEQIEDSKFNDFVPEGIIRSYYNELNSRDDPFTHVESFNY